MKISRRTLGAGVVGAGLNVALSRALFAQAAPEPSSPRNILTPPIVPGVTLQSAPVELAGDWGAMIPQSAKTVVERMRLSCLDGVRLVSDRQPTRLRVDRHTSGSPAVWLHPDGSTTAWVIVDVGERAWIQLAYQFGHELGHVMANSWLAHATPTGPSEWLEEAIVEAFSLRGLGRLGRSWKANPPFPNDQAYGDAILAYRTDIVQAYTRLAAEQGGAQDLKAWLARRGGKIGTGLNPFARAVSLSVLETLERAADSVEAIGALNRWPGRGNLQLADYLGQWEASCKELGASTALPVQLRKGFIGA